MDLKTYLRNRDLLFFLLTSLISWQILRVSDCFVDSVIYPISLKHVFNNNPNFEFLGVKLEFDKIFCLIVKLIIIIFIIYLIFVLFI